MSELGQEEVALLYLLFCAVAVLGSLRSASRVFELLRGDLRPEDWEALGSPETPLDLFRGPSGAWRSFMGDREYRDRCSPSAIAGIERERRFVKMWFGTAIVLGVVLIVSGLM